MGNPLTVRDPAVLTSWRSDWSGLRVLVLGAGETGFAAADTLVELGARVLVVAASVNEDRARLFEVIGASVIIEPDSAIRPSEVDSFDPELVIVSPGFPEVHPMLTWTAEKGIPTWGDVELAWRLRDKLGVPSDWILVAGEGIASIAAHLLNYAGRAAMAVVDEPALHAVRDPTGFEYLVVELSPAQLGRIDQSTLAPAASVCLSAREFGGRVYANTRLACLYNRADDATMVMVEEAEVQEGCRAIGFSLGAPGPSDVGMVDDILLDRAFHPDRHHTAIELATHAELEAVGLGSSAGVERVLVAAALVRALDVPVDAVRAGLAALAP